MAADVSVILAQFWEEADVDGIIGSFRDECPQLSPAGDLWFLAANPLR
jgi:hypothetical protein